MVNADRGKFSRRPGNFSRAGLSGIKDVDLTGVSGGVGFTGSGAGAAREVASQAPGIPAGRWWLALSDWSSHLYSPMS